MKPERLLPGPRPGWRSLCLALCLLGLAACATPPASSERQGPGAALLLAYYQHLGTLSAAELGRERQSLNGQGAGPENQLRQAMVLGHPRLAVPDLPKALGLLDHLLKSADPAARELKPLARLLADAYAERLRLEGNLDRQGLQLKESQRKATELQEKLDGLADIERTLPRTRPPRPVGKKGNP